MIIEIHKPEVENLIRERMASGAFQNVEDVLMRPLKSSPAVEQPAAPLTKPFTITFVSTRKPLRGQRSRG